MGAQLAKGHFLTNQTKQQPVGRLGRSRIAGMVIAAFSHTGRDKGMTGD